jgi:hypothetical protein
MVFGVMLVVAALVIGAAQAALGLIAAILPAQQPTRIARRESPERREPPTPRPPTYAGPIMATLRVDALQLPTNLGLSSLGYGTAVIGLPATRSALFAAIAGQAAVRCLRVDERGNVTIVPKVRGLLRDSEAEDANHVWVLATHGLHLVDLARNTVLDTIRDRLPAYPARLNRLDGQHLIVSWTGSSVAAVVSTRAATVVDRIRMPTVDCVVAGDQLTLCSFERGIARRVGASWRRIGRDQPLPTGLALRLDDRIAAVLTDLVPIAPGAPQTGPRSREVVAVFSKTFELIAERIVEGILRLDDHASSDRLLGVTEDAIVVLDAMTLEELGRTGPLGLGPAVGAIAHDRAMVVVEDPRTVSPQAFVIGWD